MIVVDTNVIADSTLSGCRPLAVIRGLAEKAYDSRIALCSIRATLAGRHNTVRQGCLCEHE
jgi:hypothetical protein